ncbi:MAG TPA: YbaB/EbfC family nucleoid-associated protein [Candidatus Saccharimonadales bacterium]|nr:YbaB/EbfC family nucleoid-associated protein [Candidatus Saccharimonadales bacterium]
MFDKAKTLYELKKIQSALSKETIDIETGNGAVKVTINGEQKIKSISIDPELVDLDEISKLEKWLESAVTQAITRSQQLAAEKMKSVAGGLGLPGL